MSSTEIASPHDVYEGLDEEELHKTEYMLQFPWNDIVSDFDVGPYFSLPGSIEA